MKRFYILVVLMMAIVGSSLVHESYASPSNEKRAYFQLDKRKKKGSYRKKSTKYKKKRGNHKFMFF